MGKAKRSYKDGTFRTLFNNEEKLLELYNALSGSHYPKGTKVRIVTLEDAIFGDIKNDLAFIIDDRLIILIEHQSSISFNMPLRMLVYIAREYERLYFSEAIYSKKLVKIPTPELYVFYNGKAPAPLEQELKLSDAFIEKCGKLSLEAVVKVINVNYEQGAELLARCRTLAQYSQFIYLVRKNWEEKNHLESAIRDAIDLCIRQGVLTDFLKKNGGDIMSFLFEALTREECEAIREEDGYARGKADGLVQGAKAIAKKMRLQGFSAKEIEDLTGLTQEDLEDLSDEPYEDENQE
ncbi:hypothetical protein NE619_01695 [Anaerovorax odorimutans]|uniref:Transposase (putative) YhgA-like domain-containing protein n=1 Tax=Anaerovorax odorimutans TaxID=109327 RepID=A0ABT1RJT8_9FIRM|nr:hypothetical protein [Anaerovorax odorimutans]MCQ4635430.1 hypothetical protein [Anaerovorax odorimutans]